MDWIKEFPAAITVCDRQGIVIAMNEKACATFAEEGGAKLIGHSLQDCHKPESWQKILRIMETGIANTYTIEKNGVRKLIHQQCWFSNGAAAGLVEISIVLPEEMPHYVR
jgi:hypothetical protein